MEIGEGCIVYEGVILTANISIGNHVIISPKCGIGHDTVIKIMFLFYGMSIYQVMTKLEKELCLEQDPQ